MEGRTGGVIALRFLEGCTRATAAVGPAADDGRARFHGTAAARPRQEVADSDSGGLAEAARRRTSDPVDDGGVPTGETRAGRTTVRTTVRTTEPHHR